MTVIDSVVLWGHIITGAIAVLAGVGALVTKKGGLWHRRAGKLFVAMMAVVVVSTFVLAVLEPTSFRILLSLVAIFSGYFAFSGYRVLSRKRPDAGPGQLDWVAAASVLVACLALAVWGLSWYLDSRTFGIVMVVFGGIGVGFGGLDLNGFHRGDQSPWLVTHLQRMLAAFIATVSAVSAVNLTPMLGILAWLWPTIVGVPLIVYWSREFE